MVAEGIETALSLASGLLQRPSGDLGGALHLGLSALRLPPRQGRLTVAADGDPAGRHAAGAGRPGRCPGLEVYLLTPPRAQDWNDVLVGTTQEAVA